MLNRLNETVYFILQENMTKPLSQASDFEMISRNGIAEIILNHQTGQRSLHATRPFKAGECICRFEAGEILETPNYLTVQVGDNKHITLIPSFLQYTNHSCSPNVFFDTTAMELVALKDIESNEEFTFFYPSTEYDMAQPFICFCGSQDCLRNIRGARYLSRDIQNKHRFTDYIKQLL